jgi:hypothetical protein
MKRKKRENNKAASRSLILLSLISAMQMIRSQQQATASVPQPPAAAQLEIPSDQPQIGTDKQVVSEIPQGLDTLGSDSSGNWLLKRVWWEQAETVFDEIVGLSSKSCAVPRDYLASYSKARNDFANIMNTAGVEFGTLSERINDLIDAAQEASKISLGQTVGAHQVFIERVQERKGDLEQLKKDLKAIEDLTSNILKVMDQVDQYVARCQDYELDAWQNFKEIARVLDDQRAKVLYYTIVSDRENIKRLIAYLQSDLKRFFDSALSSRMSAAQSVVQGLNKLKAAEIDYERQLSDIKKQYADELAQRELEEKKQEQQKKQQEQQKKEAKIKNSWFSFSFWIDSISGFFGAIATWVKSFF